MKKYGKKWEVGIWARGKKEHRVLEEGREGGTVASDREEGEAEEPTGWGEASWGPSGAFL